MRTRVLITIAMAIALVAAVALSFAIGSRTIDLGTVWHALTAYNPDDPEQAIVRELRGSRTLIGVLAGGALAVAGALMQSLTRNPFAEPGLLGINAGASFAVVLGLVTGVATGFSAQVWVAFVGAGLTAVAVYLIGARGASGGAPVRLALAGVAIASLITSVTYALLLVLDEELDVFRFWVVGSLVGRQGNDITALIPIVVVAVLVGLLSARRLEAIALGDDAAQALGVNLAATRALVIVVVTILAGAATAAAGPLIFVGLAIPHLLRPFTGASLPWLVTACAFGGGAFVLVCDVLGRVIARPAEVPVGVMTAFVGGILFAIMARRMKVVEL
ncbi:iron ABC transporter permease [Demequina capsici]|uniref:Iron ABC transporter permease n=1 Tax=Demequina capsici TaxID=3075620 RepID=A0AA96FE68_9MICO|nr:iron ABC transporter permease [Demequina sp. PMTSA13]WNM27977.1 iron ABC transporter permease [Demequina sp. PMTSA13]